MLTCKGTIGAIATHHLPKSHIARQIMAIRPIKIDPSFIKCFIKTYIQELQSKAKSLIPGISREDLLQTLIPIPPIKEQSRINKRICKLLDFINKL